MMADSERVLNLEKQWHSLQQELWEIQLRNKVLVALLEEAGILNNEMMEADVHRRRFLGWCSSFPFALDKSFLDVVQDSGVALSICSYIGRSQVPDLVSVSKAVDAGLRSLAAHALEAVPPQIIFGTSCRYTLELNYFFPSTIRLVRLPPMLEKRQFAAFVRSRKNVFVLGGKNPSHSEQSLDSMECYDGDQSAWSPLPAMSCARSGPAAAIWDGKIFVMGGSRGGQAEDNYLASVDYYEVASRRWTELPSMKHARFSATAAATSGKVFICGGWSGGSAGCTLHHTVECFDMVSNTWEELQPMLSRRSRAVAAVQGHHLYVLGGNHRNECECEFYDMATKSWARMPPLDFPEPTSATVIDGVLVALGRISSGWISSGMRCSCFNDITFEWQSLSEFKHFHWRNTTDRD